MLASPSAFEFVQADIQQLEDLDFSAAQSTFKVLAGRGQDLLEMSGLDKSDMTFENSALMRYVGQGYEVEVPLDISTIEKEDKDEITTRFEIVYQELFGRVEVMPLEVISWRVVVSGPTPEFSLANAKGAEIEGEARKGHRPVYFGDDGYVDTPVYDRTFLKQGFTAKGPAIVEERESTLVVPPDFSLTLHPSGNLILDRG